MMICSRKQTKLRHRLGTKVRVRFTIPTADKTKPRHTPIVLERCGHPSQGRSQWIDLRFSRGRYWRVWLHGCNWGGDLCASHTCRKLCTVNTSIALPTLKHPENTSTSLLLLPGMSWRWPLVFSPPPPPVSEGGPALAVQIVRGSRPWPPRVQIDRREAGSPPGGGLPPWGCRVVAVGTRAGHI